MQWCFLLSLVEIGPVILKKKILLLSFLGPWFEQTWILFNQECFVPTLVKFVLVALIAEEDENVQSLRQQQQRQQWTNLD